MQIDRHQLGGHEAPDDRLTEDDCVVREAGDEHHDKDDLAQKFDDAGQEGQHLFAHALQRIPVRQQDAQHGVEGGVPDQIPCAVFQHHRLRGTGHQPDHPFCPHAHQHRDGGGHHDAVEDDVSHPAPDAVGVVRAVVLGYERRAGGGHRRQRHIREGKELPGGGVARDDQCAQPVDAILQHHRACRDDAAHKAHRDALAEQLPVEAAAHMEVLFLGQEQPGTAEDVQDAEHHRHSLRDDRGHARTGYPHAQHGDEPEVEDDIEH